MRIVCPACNAAYEIAPERVPPGRLVGCARCATRWAPVAAVVPPAVPTDTAGHGLSGGPEAVPVQAPAATPEPEAHPSPNPAPPFDRVAAAADRAAAVPVRPGRALLVAAWVLSLLVLGAAGWAAVAQREAVMRAWPASERAYAALHLS